MPAALRGRLMRYLASRHRKGRRVPVTATDLDGEAVTTLWAAIEAVDRCVVRALYDDGGTATADSLMRAAGCANMSELMAVLCRIDGRLRGLTAGREVSFCGRGPGAGTFSIARTTWQHLHQLFQVEERRGLLRLVADAGPTQQGSS